MKLRQLLDHPWIGVRKKILAAEERWALRYSAPKFQIFTNSNARGSKNFPSLSKNSTFFNVTFYAESDSMHVLMHRKSFRVSTLSESRT